MSAPRQAYSLDDNNILLKKIADNTYAVAAADGTVQLSGVPSSFTVGSMDTLVFTLADGEVGFIQNLHTTALAVKRGDEASSTSFSFILNGGVAQDDGNGGAILITDFIGPVSVAAMTGSPRYIAWKQA